jgi:hypothetical protein
MPITSFVSSPTFVWPPPVCPPKLPEPEVRAPAPPTDAERRTAAALRLLRRFETVEKSSPKEWRIRAKLAAPGIGFSGKSPEGRCARWSHLASRDVVDGYGLLYCVSTADVPGLPGLCRALRACQKLADKLDPTDPTAAVFGGLVRRILCERWVDGAFLPHADGTHRIAVAYPAPLLAALREWFEAEPARLGRKPDPVGELIAKRCDEMRQERQRWKDMVARIEAEFAVALKSESLRKLWTRWKRETKTGTE